MSVDGVGERVALKMIMETDAFTSFTDPRKFCCHAGVVPFVYVSGSSQRSKIEYLIGLTKASSICYIWRHYLFHK